MKLTVDDLARATGAERKHAAIYCDALNVAMDRFEINTARRCAAFLATVSIESEHLTAVEEDMYYRDAERLCALYSRAFSSAHAAVTYVRNPKALSDLLYRGYHGRGLIQVTWMRNYEAAGLALGYDYVGNPDLLLQPKHAALSAAWFWSANGCNEAADRGDMSDVTRRVNGPARLRLAERTAQYVDNMTWMPAVESA